MMEWYKIILITVTGFVSGFLNTMAGGGSLIALPVLIFLGLPPAVANGTNRIAILAQNISGVAGFRSKGIFIFPYNDLRIVLLRRSPRGQRIRLPRA